ncbi:hypothetical protein SeMB42_g05121 [Synchytrium endobioticum]|uniref:Uncharacterized protein n=1 Tax=Synchytrium endobioticum TaxID=286115 RepID=A0A507CTP3_9FUNG|nr:hypothetical protein SeMB42_g05121 [Synchytrium endobioticum]
MQRVKIGIVPWIDLGSLTKYSRTNVTLVDHQLSFCVNAPVNTMVLQRNTLTHDARTWVYCASMRLTTTDRHQQHRFVLAFRPCVLFRHITA